MNRWIRTGSWLLFAAIMYLIFEEAVWPWFKLPALGNVGFSSVFVLFALVHCAALAGLRYTALFFAISAIFSYLTEEIGVRTGIIYGAYHYSNLLGVKLGHVPVIIPLAWFMMIYPSWRVAKALMSGVNTHSMPGIIAQASTASLVMTAWDMVMDPSMAVAGNWIWQNGGVYFGVPRRNYLGWLLTTFLVYWIAGWLWRDTEHRLGASRTFSALPIVVYAFFAVRYVMSDPLPALQLIAVFSMGMPALVALIQVCLNRNNAAIDP